MCVCIENMYNLKNKVLNLTVMANTARLYNIASSAILSLVQNRLSSCGENGVVSILDACISSFQFFV